MGSRFCRAMRVMTILLGISFTTAIASEADQLFSNGPVASLPSGGPGGAPVSRLQSSLGMTSLGFNVDFGTSSIRAFRRCPVGDTSPESGVGARLTQMVSTA